MNPIAELAVFRALLRLYRTLRPDLIHHVTIKPVIYGSLAARIVGHRAVVNAVSGLGYSFSPGARTALLRPVIKGLYRLALRSAEAVTIFQNTDDREDFLAMGLIRPEQTAIVRGSGVDCAKFLPGRHESNTVILAGRILWDKGVGVFVDAARLIRSTFPDTRFILVGMIDSGNRAAIPSSELERWADEGVVEWWGPRSDMPDILGNAQIAVLPSLHREGLPKVLLEAAACTLPVIASDVPGCREIVRQNINGLVVPPGDPKALAAAIEKLLKSRELRERYGAAGRTIVEQEFSEDKVIRQVLDIYRRVLKQQWPPQSAGDQ